MKEKRPHEIPEVRRGKWSPPFDKRYWRVGEELRRPGEYSIVTNLCKYKRRRVHFVVWMPASAWSRGMQKAYGTPVLVLIAVVIAMVQLALPVGWILLTGLVGAFATWRFINRYGGRYMRVWENCTGFLLLNEKGRPMDDTALYDDFFKAYVTWEEAYLRPAVLQRFSKKALESRFKMIENWALLGREVKMPTKGKLDQQVQETHEALSLSEERLTAKTKEKEILGTQLNNLLYRISEDMEIRRTELVRKLGRLRKIEEQIADSILKRTEEYEYWLALLDAKGLRVRFTLWGSIIIIAGAIISTLLSQKPYPLLLLALPVVKYVIDVLGGVRGLRRAESRHRASAESIQTALVRLEPRFDAALIRAPP